MTRSWMVFSAPIALAAGLMLAHCSSSSSSGGGGTDGGSGTGSHSGSGSGTGSHSGSGSASGTGSSSGSGSHSGSGSTAGSGTGNPIVADPDSPANCKPPAGGRTCTPGTVPCGDAGISVPGNQCCNGVAQKSGTTCSTQNIQCEETGDCASGEICCLAAFTSTSGQATCIKGTTCPTKSPTNASYLAAAQICRSSSECSSGSCNYYSCAGTTIESCTNPQPPNYPITLCTPMFDAGASGSGS